MTIITTLLRQYYLNLLCLLISIGLIYCASTYWFSASHPVKNNLNVEIISKQINTPHKNALYSYPLFGEHLKNTLDSKNIPTTLLNLKLIGILKASKPQDSQAFIKVGDSDEQLYFINDEVSENTRLLRILENAVLLKRNGKIERLSLPKENLNTKDTEID